MTATIEIKKVTKYYGRAKTPSVDNLSLRIEAGEVYGFLGANGAGKSTTIRMMLDFIRPSKGMIRILGQESREQSHRKQVGYLAGDVALPKSTTGRKLLHYLAALSGGIDEKYLSVLTERFEAQLDKKIGTLSKGNRQKIGLIQAFMHQPSVIILDEPTSGLDPLMQEQFYKTVHEARERGAAVFLSSHSFEEVERICDRIGIVRGGKLVYEGPIADILSAHVPKWHIALAKKTDLDQIKKSPALKTTNEAGLTLTVEPTGPIEKALGALAKVSIISMTSSQSELEDEFLSFYGEDKEEKR